MGTIGAVAKKTITIPFTEYSIVINSETFLMIGITCFILVVLSYFLGKRTDKKPCRLQSFSEFIINAFDTILIDSLGREGRKYFPLIMTIFLFILISNWIGIIPFCKSPTEDLNVCISLALVVFLITHIQSVRKKGMKKYIKTYFDPFIIFFPLNILGEIGKTLSHCFRLFGNIFGGGIIFALISLVIFKVASSILGLPDISEAVSFDLMNKTEIFTYILSSPVIIVFYVVSYAVFGLFVGAVQAFVFTMLALTYIGVALED
jgi:F-type H+-transporting ATPase subunit a